ncbi:MAG: nuclear transport factor 2 family protein [Bacteroidetes bacterium]|nr:nuclear transport factor 2 family protein [Bacteroidota bacterium]
MTTNEQLIIDFYSGFKNKNYKLMQSCYSDNAIFNDPVFVNLNAKQVRAMWEMFCVNGKEMEIEFSSIKADEAGGSANWKATYIFSTTGKKVINEIKANFVFENGKIVRHTDSFNFYGWAKQALGLTGFLLGWTAFLKNKVQKIGMKALNDYIKSDMSE